MAAPIPGEFEYDTERAPVLTSKRIHGSTGIEVVEALCPAGEYRHGAAAAFVLRLVRRGHSPARLELGAGVFDAYTRSGDLLFNPAGTATRFAIESQRQMLIVSLSEALVLPLLNEQGANPGDLGPLLQSPLRSGLLTSLCLALGEEADNGGLRGATFAEATVTAAVAELLFLAKQPVGTAAPTAPVAHRTIARCLELIEARLAEPLLLSELAQSAGMGRSAFLGAFRAATGQSPHQYILRRRAERAVALLRSGDLPLAEVALLAGFAHQAHMTNVLSRLYGLTPARIRNREDR
ncbi:helix-turn-helix domain-containing protein [Gloeobacter violaceus]|uniref:AraC family transcriptional regulatory protein n=1 Tax=Gloeobacter violaceus (strain ATCC 29082 / PCC 7421) TaxID=251221 RepID=Q7NES0_GLOVI|nr:AraC family transcriptional regulator [Gloeobacter violaceus]BAC91749.1 AraC family transcriptional regulatory protein [Gloeobacter violaceus PCC 7421]